MKWLTIIAFSLLSLNGWAQYDSLHFKMVENALLHKLDISGIYFSADGRLWFGTSNGLATFDGNDVKLYPVKDSQKRTIVNDRILAFAEDRNKAIWIVTVQINLARFSPVTGTYSQVDFLKNDTLKNGLWIAKIYFDKANKLWIGTNKGFFIYDVITGSYEHYNMNAFKPATLEDRFSNSVYDIAEDPNDPDKVWIASHGMGILSFDKKTKQLSRKFSAANAVDSVQQNGFITQVDVRDSVIWFGTWGTGMGKYNMQTGKYVMYPRNGKMYKGVYPHGHVIPRMVRKSEYEYFVALADSLPAVFDTRTGRYSYINNEALQQTINRTSSIEKDKDGNLWCLKGGRLYFASPRFQVFKTVEVPVTVTRPFTPSNILRKMLWDEKHQLYYGAIDLGEGICVYDKAFAYIKTIPLPMAKVHEYTSAVKDFEMDRTGRLWAWADTLYVYDSSQKKMVSVTEKYKSFPLFQQTFSALTTDATGNLILFTDKREIIFLDAVTFVSHTVSLPPVKTKPSVEFHVRRLLFDAKRDYVYACDGQAIFQYRIKENSFKTIEVNATRSNSLPPVNVSTYALDEGGNLWIGSRGIYIYEPTGLRIVKVLDAAGGLTDNVNINLLQGPPGYMFFFTPHGGNLYSTTDSTFIHFDLNNGLLVDFPAGYSFANNHLFLAPGVAAPNRYADMASLLSLKTIVQPYLSRIRVTNDESSPDTIAQFLSVLKLEHNQNNISFTFSSVEYAFPDKVEYAYWLQGLEKEWTVTDYMNRSVTYTNLKPADYTLRIRARMPGGKWTEMKQPLQIIIVPAFWQTTVFKIAVVLLLAFCIYLLFQQRLKSIRKKEAMKAAHQAKLIEMEADALRAQMNPHFIFNCLNSIKSLIQQKENDTAATYLTTFSKLIRTLFQHADKREVSLYEEIETCKLYTQLEALRFGNKILFQFDVDETIDAKDIFVPALILQPFIENAIWHGLVPKEEGGKVTISIHQNNGSIQCMIDDEGIGRELSKQYKSNHAATHQSKGIALTRSRLNLDRIINHRDDSIEVIDKKDNDGKAIGTTVILSFKNEKE